MKILVTGGFGFIGSHVLVELLNHDHAIVVVDDLSNSKMGVMNSVEKITGKKFTFFRESIGNVTFLEKLFDTYQFDAVMHFAAKKSVNESIQLPLLYYKTNITYTIGLLELALKYKCKTFIYSSSATVYGINSCNSNEKTEVGIGITNPYGKTKYFVEEILRDTWNANQEMTIIILRYFNPCGAHTSGLICEDPNDIPNNLMPYIYRVASGEKQTLEIFGTDYPTPDGTCMRDFIHVVDLAHGHIHVLHKIKTPGVHTYNLGTGNPTSVKDMVKTFQEINNTVIPHTYTGRREGDVAISYANVSAIQNELGWEAKLGIKEMCRDGWIAYHMAKNKDKNVGI